MGTASRVLGHSPSIDEENRSGVDHGAVTRDRKQRSPTNGDRSFLETAKLLVARGAAHARLGRNSNALDDFLAARTLYGLTGQQSEQSRACRQSAQILCNQYRYDEAIVLLEESLSCARGSGHPHEIADRLLALSRANFTAGCFDEARRCATEAFDLVGGECGDRACRSLTVLGELARLRGEFSQSRRQFMRVYSIALTNKLARWEYEALLELTDVSRETGKHEEAMRFLSRARATSEGLDAGCDVTVGLLRREGELLLQFGDPRKARELLLHAETLVTDGGQARERGRIKRCLGLCSLRLGDRAASLKHFHASLDIFRPMKLKMEIALGNFYLLQSTIDESASTDEKYNDIAGQSSRYGAEAIYLFHQLGLFAWEDRARSLAESIVRRKVLLLPRPEQRPSRTAGAEIVAVSAAMQAVLRHADNCAVLSDPVLIAGETGTGKELIARRLHEMGPRKGAPFVVVNCAAIPPDLFEREFFGNKRGAYTGAAASCGGFVQQARGGTLFLDEVGEMPLLLQPKLLRLIEYQTYCRLGDPKERRADVRLVAATNAPLQQLVDEGTFRADFYFRLRLLDIEIAPLRERKEDIVPLLELFLSRITGRAARVQDYLTPEAIEVILRRPLKGNARELMHMARKLLLQRQLSAVAGHSPDPGALEQEEYEPKGRRPKPDVLELQRVLERYDGNKAKMARHYGVARSTLYRWLAGSVPRVADGV